MPALSTWCRRDAAPDAFLARAERLGADGIVLDYSIARFSDWAVPLLTLRDRLPLVAVCLPAGPRAPSLASTDREERLAARKHAVESMSRAAELGAGAAVLRLGELRVGEDPRETARAFARRTLTSDDVERLWQRRKALSTQALDLARFAIEPLVDAAAGLTLALAGSVRTTAIPSDAEVRTLLDDFRGAQLLPWADPARVRALQALGFPVDPTLAEIAAGAFLTDGAALRRDLPWGRGEVDGAAFLASLSAGAARVVHCAPLATDDELADGLRLAAIPRPGKY